MSIQNIVAPQVDRAAEEIITHCVLDQKTGLPDYHHLKKVLSNLAIDTVEAYCDTIKEKK